MLHFVLCLNRQALYEKTSPALLALPGRLAAVVVSSCLLGAPLPPTLVEQELHASLLAGAVAMG